MPIRTVGELRRQLEARSWSPEVVAQQLPVSNMTVRRLLAREDGAALPAKYRLLFAPLAGAAPEAPQGELDPVQVVLSGRKQTRAQVLASLAKDGLGLPQAAALWRSAARHVRAHAAPSALIGMLRELKASFPRASHAGRALILGSIAYFINPFDLIADAVLSVGLIDDLGILMLVRMRLRQQGTEGV